MPLNASEITNEDLVDFFPVWIHLLALMVIRPNTVWLVVCLFVQDEEILTLWKAGKRARWPRLPSLRFAVGDRVECRTGPHPVKGLGLTWGASVSWFLNLLLVHFDMFLFLYIYYVLVFIQGGLPVESLSCIIPNLTGHRICKCSKTCNVIIICVYMRWLYYFLQIGLLPIKSRSTTAGMY
jgi:hypothetical protein